MLVLYFSPDGPTLFFPRPWGMGRDRQLGGENLRDEPEGPCWPPGGVTLLNVEDKGCSEPHLRKVMQEHDVRVEREGQGCNSLRKRYDRPHQCGFLFLPDMGTPTLLWSPGTCPVEPTLVITRTKPKSTSHISYPRPLAPLGAKTRGDQVPNTVPGTWLIHKNMLLNEHEGGNGQVGDGKAHRWQGSTGKRTTPDWDSLELHHSPRLGPHADLVSARKACRVPST